MYNVHYNEKRKPKKRQIRKGRCKVEKNQNVNNEETRIRHKPFNANKKRKIKELQEQGKNPFEITKI